MARILVVDDEVGLCERLSEALADKGHQVATATNILTGKAAFFAMRPDLVLLGVLPNLDGIALLREWSRGGKLDVPVILLSGQATIDSAMQATRIGVLDFLEKPIHLRKLFASVRRALQLRPPRSASPITTAAEINDSANTYRLPLDLPLREARQAFDRVYFERLLAQEDENVRRVAEHAGLQRDYLYHRLQQLGIPLLRKHAHERGLAVVRRKNGRPKAPS